MIKSIEYGDDQHINLEVGDVKNIYSADSFHLVIGKNGTGKTRLLKKIARAVVSPKFEFDDCKINVNYINRGKIAAIYYTSIPYKVNLPRDSSSFQNASNPIGKYAEKTVDIDQYIRLSNNLGFTTRPICVLDLNIDYVMHRFANAILESAYNTKHDSVISLLLNGKTSKNLSELLQMKDRSGFESIITKELRTALISSLLEQLESKFDAPYLKAFLKVVDSILLKRKNPSLHIQGFVKIFILSDTQKNSLNVPFNDRTSYEKHLYLLVVENFKDIKDSLDYLQVYAIKQWHEGSKTIWEIPSNQIAKFINYSSQSYIEFIWEGCSSGQLALMHQFSSISKKIKKLSQKKKAILLLIDEGDIFLHLDWQKKYIQLLDTYVSSLIADYGLLVNVILTTHSPILMTDVPKSNVIRLDRDEVQTGNHPPIRSFAAPIGEIVNNTFETLPIGEFSRNIILKILNKIEESVPLNATDNYIIEQIDNPALKQEIEYQKSHRVTDDPIN